MAEKRFTLIDEDHAIETSARVSGDSVWLTPEAVQTALGWELKPEGLCRGNVCLPLPEGEAIDARGLELKDLARRLDRPLALDSEQCVAALGASARERRSQFESLHAPDFELPDLDGVMHSLSDYRGKKVLLVAYASW